MIPVAQTLRSRARVDAAIFTWPLPGSHQVIYKRVDRSRLLEEFGPPGALVCGPFGSGDWEQTPIEFLVSRTRLAPWDWPLYEPLRESGLFRAFSDLDGSADAIVAFADRFGMLGYDGEYERVIGDVPDEEPLGRWRAEIASMRLCIAIWEALRDDTDSAVDRLFDKDKAIAVDDGTFATTVWLNYDEDALLGHSYGGDGLVSWETFPWRGAAQDSLRHRAETTLEMVVNAHLANRALTLLLSDPGQHRMVATARPASLAGAVWLQLATAIDGDKPYRKCGAPGCGNWFEVTPAISRSDKKYCSQACRSRVYRASLTRDSA